MRHHSLKLPCGRYRHGLSPPAVIIIDDTSKTIYTPIIYYLGPKESLVILYIDASSHTVKGELNRGSGSYRTYVPFQDPAFPISTNVYICTYH